MAGKKNPKKHPPKIDWNAIREDYLVQNLDPEAEKPYPIIALATHWGVSRDSCDRHAKKEDWKGELRRRAKAIADARIDAHQDGFIEQQREIRERHASVAQNLISKAVEKFNTIKNPKKELTVDQMLKMLAFAMPAEREAHGMPKFVQIQDVTPTDTERTHETPAQRMERRRIERLVDKDLAEAYTELHDAGD